MVLVLLIIAFLGLLPGLMARPWLPGGVTGRRSRALFVLSLYALIGLAQAGSALSETSDICVDGCPDDEDDARGHCLPNCHTCACGTLPALMPDLQPALEPRYSLLSWLPIVEPPHHLPLRFRHEIFRPPIA